MWLENEFSMLLHSNVSTLPVDQLTSKFGLYARNNIIHFFAGFAAFFISVYVGQKSRPYILAAFGIYAYLQIIQIDAATFSATLIDGIFDIVVPFLGYGFALWVASLSPRQAHE